MSKQENWKATDIDTLTFSLSHGLKEAIYAYAAKVNKSATSVIRESVCKTISYPLTDEPITGRHKKYKNKKERLEAQKQKAKENRQLIRTLIEADRHKRQQKDIEAIERSLNKE